MRRPFPRRLVLLPILAAAALVLAGGPSWARVELTPGAVVDGNERDLQEIMGMFERAEEHIRGRRLDALMNLYSNAYSHHRLGKSDIRHIWERLFADYDHIEGMHLFEHVRIVPSKAGARRRSGAPAT